MDFFGDVDMKEKDIVVYVNYSNIRQYIVYIGKIALSFTSTAFASIKIIRYITNEDYKPHKIGSIAHLSKNSLYTIKEFHKRFGHKIFNLIFTATSVK